VVQRQFPNSSVTLSQLVWDFGPDSNLWRSSQASARATADQERVTLQQTLLLVRTAFFNAVAFKELLAVARETLTNQHNHRTQIRGFVQVGTRPPIDLSQAESDYATAEVAVVNAVNGVRAIKVLLEPGHGSGGVHRLRRRQRRAPVARPTKTARSNRSSKTRWRRGRRSPPRRSRSRRSSS